MKSHKIKLVSFADGPFRPRKDEFVRQAERMQLFDEIYTFDLDSLDYDYRCRHADFIKSNPRGFGYWIWKPQVVRQVLLKSSPDDVIVYMDAGFTLNHHGVSRFREYIEITLDHPLKFLSFQNTHTEYKWTKADLAYRLGVHESPQIMKSSQLASGFMVLCGTVANQQLINEWIDIAVESSYKFSDDSPSVYPNHPDFIEHRHDASISSLLRKMRGTAVTHYEVQSYSHFEKNKIALPAWATRLKQ